MRELTEIAAGLERGKLEGSPFHHNLSHQQILSFGAREGRAFHVSPQYRQDRLRQKASKLCGLGLLKRQRRKGRSYAEGNFYRTTRLGREVLNLLEEMS